MNRFNAPDGTALVFDAYAPTGVPRAAVLFLHGWSDHGGRWATTGARLRDAGLAAYLVDLRGHGRSGGKRGHLSRFSQLLGDLQAFRRAVRASTPAPQVILGHSFGGLVALRYLETQPADPPIATIVSSPWLGLPQAPPAWKRYLARVLADLWPTVRIGAGIDTDHLSRDSAVNAAWGADPACHDVMTPGAWAEIHWAQRAVAHDGHRIECPLQFLLAGEDRIVDAHLARAFADGLKGSVEMRWYAEMYHEVLNDPERETVMADVLAFLSKHGL
ncbi:MAG TPA: alpha/beta hydrolase [Gemmatimonadales bacterium]|jgi:lysophospholipase